MDVKESQKGAHFGLVSCFGVLCQSFDDCIINGQYSGLYNVSEVSKSWSEESTLIQLNRYIFVYKCIQYLLKVWQVVLGVF